VKVEAVGKLVSFIVKDNGVGIPPHFVPRLFERFFRVPREAGPQGAGLGLAIAREIAEAHGGRVEYAGVPGGGSAFTLVLPAPIGAATGARDATVHV
jgi:signal transduction histidine kinase